MNGNVVMKSKSVRKLTAPALVALSLALGGCGGGTLNPGLESVHQPVVARTDFVMDVQTGGSSGLAEGESTRLAHWFESLELGYGDRVTIDDPSSYANGEARGAVAALTSRYGLLLGDGTPVTAGQVAPGTIRVVVSRMTASVDECPDWSRPSQPEFESSTTSNYGCAMAKNLAAMVASPEDLVRGQVGAGGGDARAASKAIKVFRDRIPTGMQEVKTVSSKGN